MVNQTLETKTDASIPEGFVRCTGENYNCNRIVKDSKENKFGNQIYCESCRWFYVQED